jgi:transcriptional regulator with XRE-family HTH domain
MPWYRPGPGRKPTIPDKQVKNLREQHIEQDVPLSRLSRQSGLSVSMLRKIMSGQRRQKAGGPVRATTPKPQVGSRKMAGIQADLARGKRGASIARKYGVSPQYVSEIKRGKKGHGGQKKNGK